MRKILQCIILLIGVFLCISLKAESPVGAPEELQLWKGWVLHEMPELNCPTHYADKSRPFCQWPSHLVLEVQGQKLNFNQKVKTYKTSWVQLPGGDDFWPGAVTLAGKNLPVVNVNNRPAVYLEPGDYEIMGEFHFLKQPEKIRLPDGVGLVALSIDGEPQTIDRDNQGWLWLVRKKADAASQDFIEIKYFRLLTDDVPLQSERLLRINVAGAQREIRLNDFIDEKEALSAIETKLPFKIENNSILVLAVQPGQHEVWIKSRYPAPITTLSYPNKEGLWPEDTLWAFAPQGALRLVDITGAPQIDPTQTELPNHWHRFPAYLLKKGDTLRFQEQRRGIAPFASEDLTLTRELWLNFAGNGGVVSDRLQGQVQNQWRLSQNAPLALERVNINGQEQLITEFSGQRGVEVREGQLNLLGVSTWQGALKQLPAVGWNTDVQSLATTLYLPPGWRLLAAFGPDKVPEAWLKSFTLFDLFIILFIAVVSSRLIGVKTGLLALVTLVLIHQEAGAPFYSWLHVLLAVSLLKVLAKGRLYNWVSAYFYVAMALLAVIAVPFSAKQIKEAIYPQLTIKAHYPQPIAELRQDISQSPGMKTMGQIAANTRERAQEVFALPERAEADSQTTELSQSPPPEKTQTGPAIPDWRFNAYTLYYHGPQAKVETTRFWALSAKWVSVIKVLQVALLVLFIAQLFRFGQSLLGAMVWPKWREKSYASVLLFIGIMPFLLQSQPVWADDFPSDTLLQSYAERLKNLPSCHPHCADISTAHLSISNNALTLTLQIEALATVALPLPSQLEQWQPTAILIDDQTAKAISAMGQRQWLAVEKGVHTVVIKGDVTPLNQLDLALPIRPQFMTYEIPNWQITGVKAHQVLGNSLTLTRKSDEPGVAQSQPMPIVPLVTLNRQFILGKSWRVINSIVRVVPQQGPIALKVPLLPGEEVLSDNVQVKDNTVEVNLAENQRALYYETRLAMKSPIKLVAASQAQIQEVWRFQMDPKWHAEFSGIPRIHQVSPNQQWLPTWQPYPNEVLTVSISEPTPIKGTTLTLEKSELKTQLGKTRREVSLQLQTRASIGSTQDIILPENAQIMDFQINGQRQPLTLQGGKATLPITPGEQHFAIRWTENSPMSWRTKTSRVDFQKASGNQSLSVDVPDNRWLLWVQGPAVGPAVLMWAYLVVVFALALGLGRISTIPLKTWEWFLLGLGLLVASSTAPLLVLAWFGLFALRGQWQLPHKNWVFKLTQVALAGLTLLFLLSLLHALSTGLLGKPNMHVTEPHLGSIARYGKTQLSWFADQSAGVLPEANIFSVPLYVYRLLMLMWALWLAFALIRWLKWGLNCFTAKAVWQLPPQNTSSSVN